MIIENQLIDEHLPQISFICRIFDMIANRFEHSTCRCHQTTIKNLQNAIKNNFSHFEWFDGIKIHHKSLEIGWKLYLKNFSLIMRNYEFWESNYYKIEKKKPDREYPDEHFEKLNVRTHIFMIEFCKRTIRIQ